MTGTPVEVRSGPTRPGGSAFAERGLRATVAELVERVKALYRADGIPWVVGYSGGKDSTATLQIVWSALQELPAQERSKRVYVITNDTLVENPTVAAWVRRSHHAMDAAVAKQGLPISTHLLSPEVDETFWVNLIGRGYPAPNRRFRWCTERMKINPTTRFIRSIVKDNGEAIIGSELGAPSPPHGPPGSIGGTSNLCERVCRPTTTWPRRWSTGRSWTGLTTTSGST